MTETYIVLFVVLGMVAASSFVFKNDEAKLAPAIFITAAVGALVAGMGLRIREIVEGPFGYLDGVLAVLTGMLFVMMLKDNGTLKLLLDKIITKKRSPFMQALLLILLVALPGIFTGTAIACIATTGTMVGTYLIKKGVEKTKAVEFVAVGSLLGMLMPPICLPAMVIVVSRSGSFPSTFEGFTVPLAVVTIPALVVYASMTAKKVGVLGIEKTTENVKLGKALIPLIVVAALILSHNFLYTFMPFIGYPLIFIIGTILAILLPVKKYNILESVGKGINIVAPAVAVAFAIGSALEILTLTGVSGRLATVFYTTPPALFVAVSMVIVALSGAFVGGSFAILVGVLVSYVIGAISYTSNAMLLTALSAALCVGMFMSMQGGIIERVKTTLNVQEADAKKIIKSVAIPVFLIFIIGIIYAVAYESLMFLVV